MKILLVTRTMAFGGGAESLVFMIYNELKKRIGSENIMLVSFQNSKIFKFENIDKYEKELKNDPMFKICDAKIQLRILKKNIIHLTEFEEIIKTFKPDVIHSHLFLSELYSRSINYPTAKWISHFHDKMNQFENFKLGSLFNKKKLTNFYEKLYLFNRYKINGGNHFIAISKDTYSFAKASCKDYSVSFLPNCIDLKRFKRKKIILHDKLRIINIGSFNENKNQTFFISIAIELIKLNIDFNICLIGYGELKEEIRGKIRDLGLESYFHFPGAVNNVEIYLEEANLYVHVAHQEAFGLVLIEAMAMDLPIITLNGKGNKDLIEQVENGFIIEKLDVNIFVNHIKEIWFDKNLYYKLSKNAKIFSQKYDVNFYIENLLKVYELE